MEQTTLRREERALSVLRALYGRHGYAPSKVGPFEQYDFYAENRSFLQSEGILTFTDLSGRLMALKPDVTLSIVKNAREGERAFQKSYYHENVYRAARGEKVFREIMQAGLECVGSLDACQEGEVLYLARESLRLIDKEAILDVSHMGLAEGLLDEAGLPPPSRAGVTAAIRVKNAGEVERLCGANGVDAQLTEKIVRLSTLYGPFEAAFDEARALDVNEKTAMALAELSNLYELSCLMGGGADTRLDLSLSNDLSYYTGLIFQGFVPGIPGAMLSGGRYDNLLRRLGKQLGGVGFAVYLGLLSDYDEAEDAECDILLEYGNDTDLRALAKAARMLTESGQSVRMEKEAAGPIPCRRRLRMTDRGLEIVERLD